MSFAYSQSSSFTGCLDGTKLLQKAMQEAGGQGKAEALRGAKLELMRKYGNPFFWGAFVLVGDPA